MPSMIEDLMGSGLRRRDHKRLVPTQRPLPTRPRDLFELFVAMGATASLKSLIMAADFRDAEPRGLTYIVLSRWPTAAESFNHAADFDLARHLRALILGQEFRQCLFRRICDAYPERRRMLYVRIPRCAGAHFLAMAAPMHPLFPPELTAWRRNDGQDFIPALGTYLARFVSTKTILAAQPAQTPFLTAPQTTPLPGAPFPWDLNPPPYRAGDRLFAILREPRSLILSLINAILGRLDAPAAQDDPETAAWRAQLPAQPMSATPESRKQLGRRLLRALPHRNPICTALGDGTAEGARNLCRLTDIELADLSRYSAWIRYTWDTDAEPALNTSTPYLTLADLSPDDARHLDLRVGEDLIFYRALATIQEKQDEFQTTVRGRYL